MTGFGGLGGGASASDLTASRLPRRTAAITAVVPSSAFRVKETGKRFAERGLGAGAAVGLLSIARRSSLEMARQGEKSD